MADDHTNGNEGGVQSHPAGGMPSPGKVDAERSPRRPDETDQPNMPGKPPLQDAIDESIGSAGGGPGA